MKHVLAVLVGMTVSSGAMAQAASTTLGLTCAQAERLVAARGAVVLHTGPATYDRYVRDSSFCGLQQTARPVWVRTADVAQCPIGSVCRSVEIDNGR